MSLNALTTRIVVARLLVGARASRELDGPAELIEETTLQDRLGP